MLLGRSCLWSRMQEGTLQLRAEGTATLRLRRFQTALKAAARSGEGCLVHPEPALGSLEAGLFPSWKRFTLIPA